MLQFFWSNSYLRNSTEYIKVQESNSKTYSIAFSKKSDEITSFISNPVIVSYNAKVVNLYLGNSFQVNKTLGNYNRKLS